MIIEKDITNLDLINYLFDDLVINCKIDHPTSKLARKLLFDNTNLNTYDDFYLFIYKNDFLMILFDLQRQILDHIDSSILKDIIENSYRGIVTLPLPVDFFESLQSYLVQNYPNEQESILIRVNCLKYHFDILGRVYEQVILLTDNSNYKIYTEYLLALKTNEGYQAINTSNFMENQIQELQRLKKIALMGRDRNLSEMVSFKESLKNLQLVPPGVLRSLPQGIQMSVILIIINRTERVANYFMQILKTSISKQDD